MKYILYRRTTEGLVFYKADFVDRGEHYSRSSLESKATRFDALAAAEMAADREWFIQGVNDEA